MSTMNIFDLTDTWNAAGTTFSAIKMNVTDTASAAGSLLLDLQVGGVSQFRVSKTGDINARSIVVDLNGTFGGYACAATTGGLISASSVPFSFSSTTSTTGTADVTIWRDAANTLAQRNGVNAQTFRLYNTYTDASNYERLEIGWDGGNSAFMLNATKAGTGTQRGINFLTGGNVRWSIGATTGHFLAAADGTYDIGASGANRPRNLYVASRAVIDTLTVGLGGATAVASNTALGFEVLNSASLTGVENTGVGYRALLNNTTGNYNSAMGVSALQNNTTGTENSAMGLNALYFNTTGSYNSAMGVSALLNNTTGNYNSALGRYALLSNTTGNDNSAMGVSALVSNTTGASNSAVGLNALYFNTTGGSNSAVGVSALQSNTTGGSNVAAGVSALFSNTTGASNSAAGLQALYSNTTGSNNNAMGVNALYSNTTGGNNSAVGVAALQNFVSTGNQTAIGYRALFGGDATPANNTGTNNIAIGYQAGDAITTGSTNLVIGYDIDVDSATASNQINIADRYFHDRIRLLERATDPAKPAEGNMIVWLSDGTGLGDDGDVIIASTAGGVTNYAILFDHSAGTLWP